MILECRAAVNILFADTKDIDGKAMGQMIIQLPEEELSRERIKAYLKKNNIRAEEVLSLIHIWMRGKCARIWPTAMVCCRRRWRT